MNATQHVFLVLTVLFSAATGHAGESFPTAVKDTKCVAFSEDGSLLAYSGHKKIHLIDTETRDPVRVFEGATGDISELALVDDRLVAAGDRFLGDLGPGHGRARRGDRA